MAYLHIYPADAVLFVVLVQVYPKMEKLYKMGVILTKIILKIKKIQTKTIRSK